MDWPGWPDAFQTNASVLADPVWKAKANLREEFCVCYRWSLSLEGGRLFLAVALLVVVWWGDIHGSPYNSPLCGCNRRLAVVVGMCTPLHDVAWRFWE
jgi:hypothetical protein